MQGKNKKSFQFSAAAFRSVCPVISALLLVLAFPKFNLGFLAWVSMVPLLFSLENNNAKQRFLIGYLFGIPFFAGTLYWLFGISIPGNIGLVILLSLAPAIFCYLYKCDISRPLYAIVYVPSAWVFTEYLRAHLFTGFPWELLGYSQCSNLPIIQIADITGVYGLSFLIILVNFGLYLALRKAPKRSYILLFIFIVFTASFIYGERTIRRFDPAETLRVSVIQGNIPQNIKWDPKYRDLIMGKYKSITKSAIADEKPDLVIWPETSLPGYMEEEDLRSAISDLARSEKVHLLIGTLHGEGLNAFNSACLISDNGEVMERYDKIHLVPFGEFIPFEDRLSWLRACVNKPMGDFVRGRDHTVFKFRTGTGSYSFSCLVCYEDIFPELSRRFVERGARFLINVTNDAWFGKTSAPYQHLQGSIFRAVENHVPVIRAANTGVSCIIDPNGRVVAVVKKGKDELCVDGYVTGAVSTTFVRTIYTRVGDLFAWICIILVLLKIGTDVRKTTWKRS
jgi:apolipoprotein N-acyltransferase